MLDKDKLKEEIRKINDDGFEGFIGWYGSFEAYCSIWANAIGVYAEDLIPPPLSVENAKSEMFVYLISTGNVFRGVFEQSLVKFCEGLLTEFNPNFVGVLPSSILNLNEVYDLGLRGGSSEEVATRMADLIHTWFLSGTAINNNSGVTINWS